MDKIGVAVLDTGIYPHIDFDDRIVSFCDFVNGKRRAYDDNSHGTHVAGIIAGSGKASKGKYKGLCDNCNIIAVKVLDRQGNGKIEAVLEGLDWVMQNANIYNIRVLNLSFGATASKSSSDDVLIKAVEGVWDSNIVVVTSAGNQGPKLGSVTVPGVSKKIITVGTCDDDEYVDSEGTPHYNYSGRGPTRECIVKPEIITPGSNIISCANIKNGYMVKSGTSMSAPIVAGAIAKLLTVHPEMSAKAVKLRLLERAVPCGLSKEQQGWGVLDLEKFLC